MWLEFRVSELHVIPMLSAMCNLIIENSVLVGHLGLGPSFMGWLGSGVQVSASF